VFSQKNIHYAIGFYRYEVAALVTGECDIEQQGAFIAAK
jgi:hypothetical protein